MTITTALTPWAAAVIFSLCISSFPSSLQAFLLTSPRFSAPSSRSFYNTDDNNNHISNKDNGKATNTAITYATVRRRVRGHSENLTLLRASSDTDATPSSKSLTDIADALNQATIPEVAKNCKVQVDLSSVSSATTTNYGRLGLIATENIKKGDVVLAVPYDDSFTLTPALARKSVFQDVLPAEYDGWSGDTGLVALLILNELARASDGGGKGTNLPKRSSDMENFMSTWVKSLPTPEEMALQHPLLWSEDLQELLQSSSTRKIYRLLDDIEEDATWMDERVWSKDRTNRFPPTVTLDNYNGGKEVPCFSLEGFQWAMAVASSRCVFVDGSLRLIPLLDMCNHDDIRTAEVSSGTMGAFGTTRGAQLEAQRSYAKGEEVFCSYGPKSAADYLLDYGFCPPSTQSTCVAELTLELDPQDRFHDDKLDILEFETYDSAPMDPTQSFDAVSEPGRDGEPDPAMIQFARLCKLGAKDAFLLESIFRKETWGFMALPVSEANELAVVTSIIEMCQGALQEFEEALPLEETLNEEQEGDGNEPQQQIYLCAMVRQAETRALTRTMEYLQREQEALDLKEYYQERRLKDLGLDSPWTEDSDNPDVGWGQARAPGGADYDW